jgi:DNA-binding XRE family transcriptional regulator
MLTIFSGYGIVLAILPGVRSHRENFWIDGVGVSAHLNPLKSFREKLFMSKAELARKAGISTLTIDRVEKGKSCRLETKRKIILALGLPLTEGQNIFGTGR